MCYRRLPHFSIFVARWSDGTAVDYTNWEGDGPDDSDGYLCNTMSVDHGEG